MSAQDNENGSPTASSDSDSAQTDAEAHFEEEASELGEDWEGESLEKMNKMLGELRAEVTRLKAHRAKEQAQNWIERHPMLSVALASTVGAAVGYGAATYARRPPTLSEQARHRLRQLVNDAWQVAGTVGRDLSKRAAKSGQDVRERAQKTGGRLAQEARKAGETAQEEAGAFAQRLGAEAGETIRQATKEASRRIRERGEGAGEKASEAIREQAESVQEAVPDVEDPSRLKQSLWTMAGLAAGGYLAAKVRRWL